MPTPDKTQPATSHGAKPGRSAPQGASAKDVSGQQGGPGQTPSNDHQRERGEVKPAKASGSGKKPESQEEIDRSSHPPGGHREAAMIDETSRAR